MARVAPEKYDTLAYCQHPQLAITYSGVNKMQNLLENLKSIHKEYFDTSMDSWVLTDVRIHADGVAEGLEIAIEEIQKYIETSKNQEKINKK